METTEQKLNTVLCVIEEPLREQLYNSFHLRNPLDFARYLHSLDDVSDEVKREMLALKVSQPPAFKGEGLDVLVERAAQLRWQQLAANAAKVENQ